MNTYGDHVAPPLMPPPARGAPARRRRRPRGRVPVRPRGRRPTWSPDDWEFTPEAGRAGRRRRERRACPTSDQEAPSAPPPDAAPPIPPRRRKDPAHARDDLGCARDACPLRSAPRGRASAGATTGLRPGRVSGGDTRASWPPGRGSGHRRRVRLATRRAREERFPEPCFFFSVHTAAPCGRVGRVPVLGSLGWAAASSRHLARF